jgi:hypothetical protein
MSSLAGTQGSWVRIPLETWMYCVYSVFVLGSGFEAGWSLVQGVLPNVLDWETEVKRSVSRMPYAPSGSNGNKGTKYNFYRCLHPVAYITLLNYVYRLRTRLLFILHYMFRPQRGIFRCSIYITLLLLCAFTHFSSSMLALVCVHTPIRPLVMFYVVCFWWFMIIS